ncbi:MAG: carboxyl-terminal processing protease [Verrucomicrobia bacterium]|nr:MAG: carboxyl-terminal processing protease [Verrucomicrobiota bacterium]
MAKHYGSIGAQLRILLIPTLFFGTFLVLPHCLVAREGDNFGQIAAKVANLLQHEHYNDQPVNDKVSSEMLDNYLEFLDMGRMYFLQSDIDTFDTKFRDKLDDLLLMQNVGAAQEIYNLYKDRVAIRIAKVQELLKTREFTFDSNATIEVSRKDAKWPADEAAADELWSRMIENELLQEVLRREIPDKQPGASRDEEEEASEKNADGTPKSPKEIVAKRYERILESINENSPEEVVGFFLKSLAHAYDPHSEYFTQSEYDNFRISMQKSLDGIGALLSMTDSGHAEIKGLVVGGPAQTSGELQVGDRITHVGQGTSGEMQDILHMKLQKVVDLIRGKRGSVVRLRVIPNGKDPSNTVDILIKRNRVELKESLARAELIETKDPKGKPLRLGWIDLPSFYSDMDTGQTSVTKDTERLLTRLMKEKIDGLILDLSQNGGGSLEEAINLTGLFIRRGPVVQSRDSRENRDVKTSPSAEPVYSGPLVLLTSKSSASASEILAAALQDYNRAVIVGEQSTFGKGTVQQLLPVTTNQFNLLIPGADNNQQGALKLTIQKFYRIAGGSTQGKGVVPDIHLPSITEVMEIGESSMKNSLPYDEIESQKFALFQKTPLPIEELARRSKERVASDPDFQWVKEEIARFQKRKEQNSLSLNQKIRISEIKEQDVKSNERTEAMKARYTKLRESEKGLYSTYSLTLDDLANEKLRLLSEISDQELSGMMTGVRKERTAEERALEPPHGIGYVKREALSTLQDLIQLTRNPLPRLAEKPAPAPASSPN